MIEEDSQIATKIYHIDRDYSKPLEQQKKELKDLYRDFDYLWTNKAIGPAKIHFVASDKKGEDNER